jgi:ribonuclease P/MRP protein subunit POP5
LRDKRRYLLVRIEPAGTVIDAKDLYYAIADAINSLWGDAMAAVIQQAVVAAEGQYMVIRCRRGTERELAIALSTTTACRDSRFSLRIMAASGTIESLREKIRQEDPPKSCGSEPGEFIVGNKPYLAIHCDGQKVDVIEKGFKNTNRLFLTREDLEES